MKTKFHHNLKFDTTQRKIEKFICTIKILLKSYTEDWYHFQSRNLHILQINSYHKYCVWFCTKHS